MTRYLETIGVEGDGRIPLASYHLRRMRATLGGMPDHLATEEDLARLWLRHRPTEEAPQYKLRIVYGAEGIEEVTAAPYLYDIRQVRRLWPVVIPESYRYDRKYLDRTLLDRAAALLPDRETLALLIQGGRVTDTTFTSVCLRASGGEWVTPARPLLRGTRRQYYLDRGLLRPVEVTLADLLAGRWDEIALINALNPLGRCILPYEAVEGDALLSITEEGGGAAFVT